MSSFRAPGLSTPLNMFIAFIIATEWIAVKFIMQYYLKTQDAKIKAKPNIDISKMPSAVEMAIYYVPLIIGTATYTILNLTFLNIALTDISRRNI